MNVAVIIPVFNAGPWLEAAVASCLREPPVGEVWLADDGSTDDSCARATALAAADPRVRVLRHPDGGNHGSAAARNLGLAAARGDAVAFLDADDWYLPGRFRAALERLARDPDLDGVYEPVGVAFEDDEARREWFRRNDFEITMLRTACAPEEVFEALAGSREGYIHLDGLVLRRAAAERVGWFDPTLRLGEDSAYCLRAAALCRLGRASDTPVAVRRLHGRNTILGPRWQARRPLIVAMWRSLFDWSVDRGLSVACRDAAADAYLRAAEGGAGDGRLIARARLRWAALRHVIRRHPRFGQRAAFWRHVGRAADVTKLRRLVTGVPPS